MGAGTLTRVMAAVLFACSLTGEAEPSIAFEGERLVEGIRIETGVEGKVGIFVQLSGFFTAECFTIAGTPLRLVCDFHGARLGEGVRKKIDPANDIVQGVRVGYHREPRKVRIVVDLDPARDYVIDRLFEQRKKQYVLVVQSQ